MGHCHTRFSEQQGQQPCGTAALCAGCIKAKQVCKPAPPPCQEPAQVRVSSSWQNLATMQALSMSLATLRDWLRLPHLPQAAAARTPCRSCAARWSAAAGGPPPHRGSAGTCTRAHSREPPAGTCTPHTASDQLPHSSCTWPAHSRLRTPLQKLWALISATKVWVQGPHLTLLCKLLVLLHCTHMGPRMQLLLLDAWKLERPRLPCKPRLS